MNLNAKLTRYGWVGFIDGRCATAPCISFGEALSELADVVALLSAHIESAIGALEGKEAER